VARTQSRAGRLDAGFGVERGNVYRNGVTPLVQPLDQSGAADNVWLKRGNIQFRRQDRQGHRSRVTHTIRTGRKSRNEVDYQIVETG
jgi:hypothetical protein